MELSTEQTTLTGRIENPESKANDTEKSVDKVSLFQSFMQRSCERKKSLDVDAPLKSSVHLDFWWTECQFRKTLAVQNAQAKLHTTMVLVIFVAFDLCKIT